MGKGIVAGRQIRGAQVIIDIIGKTAPPAGILQQAADALIVSFGSS